ncbi:MAG: hypothetical protein ACK4E0_05550 [Chitinophagaceae bacterium]
MTNEELIKKHPGTLLEKIVNELSSQESVDIYFEDTDEDQWAAVKIHLYEEDKEMALQLYSEDRWVLQLGYYDSEDEFIELFQELTPAEVKMVPISLQKLMQKVVMDEEGLRVPAVLISK